MKKKYKKVSNVFIEKKKDKRLGFMSLLQFEKKKTVGVVLIFCSSDFHGSLHVK